MVSVKLNKYIFFIDEKVEVTISDVYMISKNILKIINKGKRVYYFEWYNFHGETVIHVFNVTKDMIGTNVLLIEVYDLNGNLKDKAETSFIVRSYGDKGGFEDIQLIISQYAPYILMFGLPFLFLASRRKSK